jgi:hypothetical protein
MKWVTQIMTGHTFPHLVEDECGQRLTLHVLSDDQQGALGLGHHLLKDGKQGGETASTVIGSQSEKQGQVKSESVG